MDRRTNSSGSAALILLLTAGLAACGGGGGSSSSSGQGTPNRPPQLTATALAVNEDEVLNAQLAASDPDGESLTFSKTSDPQHGAVTVAASGAVTYTPAHDYNGPDQFNVRVGDARGATADGTITVSVRSVNDPPTAHDDELRLGVGTVTLSLLANDVEPDQDNLAVTILSQPRGGTISVTNGNVVTFVPENEYTGPASFTYRITDPAGLTSDASAALVVGDFAGVVFSADQTTPGRRELHFYDGFRTVRINPALPAGATVGFFTMGSDGRHVAYNVNTADFDQIFLADITEPGSARLLYTTAGPEQWELPTVVLNRDASYVLIKDPSHPSPLKIVLVRTADALVSVVGASNPGLPHPGSFMTFNPVTDEFYLQAQVVPPMSSSGFRTLFGGSVLSPATLTQLGGNYVADWNNGSGRSIAVTPDGQRVVHLGETHSTSLQTTWDVLVNHRPSNSESYAYRPFVPSEMFDPVEFGLSQDGARVCYVLDSAPPNPGPGSVLGPSAVWFSELAAVANGTAVSPQTAGTYVYGCRWASDNHSVLYLSAPSTGPYELWTASTTQPGTARRLHAPLAAGEEVDFYKPASKAMVAVFGVRPAGSMMPDFYRAALDAPGSGVKFANGSFQTGSSGLALNARGTLLAYLKSELLSGGVGAIDQLRLMSTQTTDYNWVVSRPDATIGVLQFEFVPVP